jgi:hypothetical protein
VLLACSSASAQEIRIRAAAPSADRVMADAKDIVTLTPNKSLQKEWSNLKEVLDGFLMGVNTKEPLRIDFLVGKDASNNPAISFESFYPIQKFEGKNFDSFLENVDSLGFKINKMPPPNVGLYKLTQRGVAKPMYLRYYKESKYAVIADTDKQIPANLPDPKEPIQALLEPGYDVAAEIDNEAEGADRRKKEFEGLREQLEAAIKFKRNEDKAEFELRKLTAHQIFDEAERFLVEADLLRAGWTTPDGGKSGRGDLVLTALPDTKLFPSSLLDSIRLLATKPSYFANVELHQKPAFTGKINFPLDEMRKQQARERHPVFRAASKAAIDKRKNLTDSGKAAAKEAIDKLADIFDASVETDIGVDGFVDMHETGDKSYTIVAGLRAVETQNADDIVALLPKIREDWEVTMNAAEHGGVKIHEIRVPKRRQPEFNALFAGEPKLYIGSSEKAVWMAAGMGALDALKAAIDQQARPLPEKPDPTFFSGTMRFDPFLKLLDVIRQQEPKSTEKKTKQEIQQEKERDRLRQLALEAFGLGEDELTARLTRDGDEVKGEMTAHEGIFRFIGSAVADFSKENLH